MHFLNIYIYIYIYIYTHPTPPRHARAHTNAFLEFIYIYIYLYLYLYPPPLSQVIFDVNMLMPQPTTVHGFALWFDVLFDGSQTPVFLSTGPHAPVTHWYQVRPLL